MGKALDKLPKIEDYVAPWEKDLADDADPKENLDLDKLKATIHLLMTDKAKAQDARTDAEAQRDQFKAQVDEKARESETDADKRERERQEAVEAAKGEGALELARLRVALRKGLTEKQAARLSGTTEEELEADADEYLAEVKPAGKDPEDDADDEVETEPDVRVTPPQGLVNGGDHRRESAREMTAAEQARRDRARTYGDF